MTSRDIGFLTLRNTIAYQSNGNPVPPNSVFVTSNNGVSIFSDNVSISTLNTGIINTSSLLIPIQIYNSTSSISEYYGKTVLLRSSTISTISLTTLPINNTSINFINWSNIPYNISTTGLSINTLLTSFYVDGLGWIAPSFYRN